MSSPEEYRKALICILDGITWSSFEQADLAQRFTRNDITLEEFEKYLRVELVQDTKYQESLDAWSDVRAENRIDAGGELLIVMFGSLREIPKHINCTDLLPIVKWSLEHNY